MPARAFDAILFDNDGVLVDTERLYFRANRDVLAEVGVALDEAAYIELFLRQGCGAWHLAAAVGVDEERIAALRARYRLAIVTSSDEEPFYRTHARTTLLPHFELVLTRKDYQNSKPDPEPYLLAVRRLGLAPERCLVIEDSERGLRAAKAAGLACWVIPSHLTVGGRFADADAVLDALDAAAARLLADAAA